MADIIQVPNITYCGKQATEIFVKPAFYQANLEDFFKIIPNVKSSYQIILDNNLEGIIGPAQECAPVVAGEIINLEQKFLTTCAAGGRLEQCAVALRNSFLEEYLKPGVDAYNIADNSGYIFDYISQKVIEAINTDTFAIAWFGDVLSANRTLSTCDGIWKKLINSSIAYGVTKAYTFSANLTDCESVDALNAVWDAADYRLDALDNSKKYIAVTRSIWENYRKCIEDKCCGDYGVMQMVNGVQTLYFRGVELRKVNEWDRLINLYGLAYPHRILYTSTDNLLLGAEFLGNESLFKFFYSDYYNKNYIDILYLMGVQFAYDEMTVIAY